MEISRVSMPLSRVKCLLNASVNVLFGWLNQVIYLKRLIILDNNSEMEDLMKDIAMENLTKDVAIYVNNEMRLLDIRAENDVLMRQIEQLETKINRAKKRGQRPNMLDINALNKKVFKSLYLLAERDTLLVIGNKLIKESVLHRQIEHRRKYLDGKFRKELYRRQYIRLCKAPRLHHIDFNIVK